MRTLSFVAFLILFALSQAFSQSQALQEFTGCRLVNVDWSDGDSFRVMFPNGEEHTIRLYGVDCMEIHLEGDDSGARRLRDQRRYFGIAEILKAKEAGRVARDFTNEMLAQPFTVRTAFADGRGDPQFKRIYGFVTASTGKDLGSELVRNGHARAFGVYRQSPEGVSAEETKQQFADLELQAAMARRGAWALTDWERLPEERRAMRQEADELNAAQSGVSNPGALLDPNTASRDELMTLKGIGEALAMAIIENRPYSKIDDLLRVPGIGPATLARFRERIELLKLPAEDATSAM